ncbi:hypothetical protein GGR50DRAFT_686501 [Xylaria sp. CBS 124048]|nr:hypothetical protein GGR50DRAFT_686501 [Xylaria sp. CBS 124048]
MTTISLDPQAIEQLSGERKTLIDAIDSLRKHGIAHRVDIPQIIVVGEPSSGKSSVLEAISRVRFPVKDRLCTRIATELVLRTDPQVKLRVRVRPSSFSSHLAHTFDETSFDKDDLPRIVEEAETHLLRGALGFSEDVLRIEICAPHLPHLTLIDLPGFIHTGSDGGKQSATDREIVDLLLARYMAKKDNVILAVVSADNQASLQRVLSKVQRHDKKYERTFGIITKLDLLDQGSEDEDSLLKLVRNQDSSYRLALGWHILRNRSATEASLSSADRDVKELEFFDSSVWSAIPANTRGATTLRKKLANILFDHTRSGLNTVIKDLDGNLKTRQKALAQLGEPKSSPRQLREYLGKIASQFQLLSLHAIEGNYSHEFFGGLYPDSSASAVDDNRIKKLRALVRDLNRTFAYILATKGSRRIICDNTLDGAGKNPKLDLPPFLRVLHDQYTFENPETVTRNAIREELEPLSSANQGTELPGGANDLLVVKLFRDQSAPWEDIARFHIDLVLRIVKAFTEKLVAHITGSDEKTRSAILLNIVDPFFEKRATELENKLQELLYNYRRGYAQPLDADFRSIMDKHRQDALATETLRKLLADRPGLFTENGKRELSSLSTNGRKSDFGVDSVIDKSETYYELSLRTFTDNVVILAVENCLINDLPTIFTTGRVCQMKDDELTVLAAESADLQAERSLLQRECQALKEVLDLCKTYRVRNLTGT